MSSPARTSCHFFSGAYPGRSTERAEVVLIGVASSDTFISRARQPEMNDLLLLGLVAVYP